MFAILQIVFYNITEKIQDLVWSSPQLSAAGGQVVELLFVPFFFYFLADVIKTKGA